MFGHEKVDEQVDRLTPRYQGRVRLDQQGRASVSAGLDLIAIDSDDQVGAWGSGDRWCLPPTPARAAISRIGALTPETTKTAPAADKQRLLVPQRVGPLASHRH